MSTTITPDPDWIPVDTDRPRGRTWTDPEQCDAMATTDVPDE